MTTDDRTPIDISSRHPNPWITSDQMAERLGVSTRTVRRRASTGELERKETPDGVRFRLAMSGHVRPDSLTEASGQVDKAPCPPLANPDDKGADEVDTPDRPSLSTPLSGQPQGARVQPSGQPSLSSQPASQQANVVPHHLHMALLAEVLAAHRRIGALEQQIIDLTEDRDRAWDAVGDLTTEMIDLECALERTKS